MLAWTEQVKCRGLNEQGTTAVCIPVAEMFRHSILLYSSANVEMIRCYKHQDNM